MTSSSSYFRIDSLLLLLLIAISPHLSAAQASFRPKALVLPITKHPLTLQYLTTLGQRTPLVSLSLVVDIGGQFLWNDCETDFVSSSYNIVYCKTAACSRTPPTQECGFCFRPAGPDCTNKNNSCKIWPYNPIRSFSTNGDIIQDVVVLQSTDGTNPGRFVKVSKFLTGCTGTNFLELLTDGVKGMAGLGRGNTALPSQLADTFGFSRKFAVCFGQKGVVIFGDVPYHFLPSKKVNYAKSLTYTPLLINKVRTGIRDGPSPEYFIGVKSIKMNGKTLNVNTTMLKINSEGYGGTKISSTDPYTVMESSIYAAVTSAFQKEMAGIQTVAPIAPFGLCYNSTHIQYNEQGPDMPLIDLVLQSSRVYWRIYGSNSMVQVRKDVLCLGFIDGGVSFQYSTDGTGLVTSIILGGHQIENNLLQFDLAASKLGFSSSLLMQQTKCSGFNFTSIA